MGWEDLIAKAARLPALRLAGLGSLFQQHCHLLRQQPSYRVRRLPRELCRRCQMRKVSKDSLCIAREAYPWAAAAGSVAACLADCSLRLVGSNRQDFLLCRRHPRRHWDVSICHRCRPFRRNRLLKCLRTKEINLVDPKS